MPGPRPWGTSDALPPPPRSSWATGGCSPTHHRPGGGTAYPKAACTLGDTQAPAPAPDALGLIDAVPLSHDHHIDNLATAA